MALSVGVVVDQRLEARIFSQRVSNRIELDPQFARRRNLHPTLEEDWCISRDWRMAERSPFEWRRENVMLTKIQTNSYARNEL